MTTYSMPLSFKKPPLTANMRFRHWSQERRIVKAIRHESGLRARAMKLPASEHIKVQLYYRPRDVRRRDASNLMPTQKALVDGLVDAGVIPDDTPEFITETIPILVPKIQGKNGRMWFDIEIVK